MTLPTSAADTRSGTDPNKVYFNGIDPDTGTYAIAPKSIEEIAGEVRANPGVDNFVAFHGEAPKSFARPFGVDMSTLAEAGWGVVFPEGISADVCDALAPLLAHRQKLAGELFHVLEYLKGEQLRDWYIRHNIASGTFEPNRVPYYLLLVGPPTLLPFDFQYLLGVEYAVGRLSFDQTEGYARYAASVVAYETAPTVKNRKEIVYWGTSHLGDPATELSNSCLVEPLANGLPNAKGREKVPIHAEVGYVHTLFSRDEAVRAALLDTLHREHPPALLFTASHGMELNGTRPRQRQDNGALLCQDWPGYGPIRDDHFLSGDMKQLDDANVQGLVAFFFACLGAGTPDFDQFPQLKSPMRLAPQPFVASLPQRLLSHPNGSALAVIGHVDVTLEFSIQPAKLTDAKIGPFRDGLGYLLSGPELKSPTGSPVGQVLMEQFGDRCKALSAVLAASTAPAAPSAMRLPERDLVRYWLEHNDAQNYILLGDPAVRIRKDAQVAATESK